MTALTSSITGCVAKNILDTISIGKKQGMISIPSRVGEYLQHYSSAKGSVAKSFHGYNILGREFYHMRYILWPKNYLQHL
jgi:hypothetical protein